jgi:hypothetical protein
MSARNFADLHLSAAEMIAWLSSTVIFSSRPPVSSMLYERSGLFLQKIPQTGLTAAPARRLMRASRRTGRVSECWRHGNMCSDHGRIHRTARDRGQWRQLCDWPPCHFEDVPATVLAFERLTESTMPRAPMHPSEIGCAAGMCALSRFAEPEV